jgi:hypothetical protein
MTKPFQIATYPIIDLQVGKNEWKQEKLRGGHMTTGTMTEENCVLSETERKLGALYKDTCKPPPLKNSQ